MSIVLGVNVKQQEDDMITTGRIPFSMTNHPDGRKLRIQCDATNEEVQVLIGEHAGDPLWDIRYKDDRLNHRWLSQWGLT